MHSSSVTKFAYASGSKCILGNVLGNIWMLFVKIEANHFENVITKKIVFHFMAKSCCNLHFFLFSRRSIIPKWQSTQWRGKIRAGDHWSGNSNHRSWRIWVILFSKEIRDKNREYRSQCGRLWSNIYRLWRHVSSTLLLKYILKKTNILHNAELILIIHNVYIHNYMF